MPEEDGALKVLVSDPFDFETFEKLQFILNRKVEIALATTESILEAINRNYGQMDDESADSMLQEFTDTAIDFTETEEDGGGGGGDDVDETSAPIVRLVQLMIGEAVQLRASDIHVEPFEDRVRIRYRIDGVLVERDSPPRRLLGALLSRIKILAKMDIAERRRCQDGRIKITAGGKELDLRVSMLPTNHGQSCVMRLLDKDNIKVGVRQLGPVGEGLQEVPQPDPPAERHRAGDGADGLRQDDHALRRPERAEPPRPQDHHGRGSGRVLPAGHQPGRGEAQHRARLRPDHPGHAAAGTERHPGRRDARLRDGIDGNSGFSNWTLGFQYAAYERCARCYYTHGRHGRARISGRRQRDRHPGPAAGARDLLEMQAAATRPREQRTGGGRHHARAGGLGQLHEGRGLQPLRQERLPRPAGHLRIDDR